MPTSSGSGKLCISNELEFLSRQFPILNVLDIGAGKGLYPTLFGEIVKDATWTAIEVWKAYIDEFKLHELYDYVIAQDARTVSYSKISFQDVVFAGDVLEHMTKEEAVALVDSVVANHKLLIISIPIIHMPQEEVNGNPYERHVKEDWSDEEVKATFKNIVHAVTDNEIGIYILSKDAKVIDLYQNVRLRPHAFLKQYERKVFSQNGEDGIIEHIFNKIGTTDKIAVEIGVAADGDGHECNSRYLAEKGWHCYWFDEARVTYKSPNVTFIEKFLTPENIEQEFSSAGLPKEFDFLGIDIDGNDYYIRQALKNYRPRVVVLEYNGSFLPNDEYIMPRNDDYHWKLWEKNFGASLMSFYKQAQELGYDLVYCENRGVNAFFIRQDLNPWSACEPKDVWVKLWWA